jgi:general transcription factor 3C polypeptide 3 (transcription factor C subunit 4)
MDPNQGYYNQWPSSGPAPGNRRFLPIAGSFGDTPPNALRPNVQSNQQQFPVQFPHGQNVFPHPQAFAHPLPLPHPQSQPQIPPVSLIPLSAVEDLQEPAPFPSGAFHDFQDPFNRAYATAGPPVYEGFIPAPGREDEDDYDNLPGGLRDFEFESSEDEEDLLERMAQEAEDEEMLRKIDEHDDYEVDADYSEEDAEEDAGDEDEMELLEDFEDKDERPRPRRGKTSARGTGVTRRQSSTRGTSRGRGTRGGRRGRPPGRGRGGFHGSTSTRGKKSGQRGRPKGPRGPRAVADPGPEFKELQRQANDRFIARDYEEALTYAQKAIQLNPEIFDAYNIASEIYAAMGEEENSIAALIAGAPTKRDPGLWQFIVERIQKIDSEKFPEYTEAAKTSAILACLNQIIALDNNYEARSHKLEIEARLGRAAKCVVLGLKMLKTRRDAGEDPDTEVLKIMAMMGTSSKRQTRFHLDKLIRSFEEAIELFTAPSRDPFENDWDWEMINIYLDLLDRRGDHSRGISQTKILSRWKQGRRNETFWNDEEDDREFDIEDEPRRIRVPLYERGSGDAPYGQTLPLEIRVKLGLFRLRRSTEDFSEAMVHPPRLAR